MEKLYKQFGELVTKWKINYIQDEFFVARLRLTIYYSITAIIILGGSSVLLYNMILSNLSQSLSENIFLNPSIAQAILDKAQDILFNRFLTIDGIIVFFVIILGFFLTHKTLIPIKYNMQKHKRFIADASHELRTPTAVIISGLEVALSNKKLDFPQAKKTLENTLEEMREFSKLSNTLLDLSRYDTQVKIEYNPVKININQLVKSTIEKIERLAIAKGINFDIKMTEIPIMVKGNEVELRRVLYNVLDNAIKYTPQSGEGISISDKISLGDYILTINDSGMGIPKNIIHKVFDPFFRGDVSRTANGAGLGLTLVKKIIENHKGTIVVKSEEKKGTNVIISLPISS